MTTRLPLRPDDSRRVNDDIRDALRRRDGAGLAALARLSPDHAAAVARELDRHAARVGSK